jgi:predicted TIM-barrel fold metal-dependent hydrolase
MSEPVLDAHVHFWDPRTTPRTVSPAVKLLGWNEALLLGLVTRVVPKATRDFVGNPGHVLHPYLPGTHRRDHEGVALAGVVHVQADWQTRDAFGYVDETRWLEELCSASLHAIVGHADLGHPRIGELLDAHARASARFVGIRDMLACCPSDPGVHDWNTPGRMQDRAWRRGYALLGERGLTFDAWVYHVQLRELEELVRAFPATRLMLDHLGTPIGLGGPYAGFGATASERERTAARWHEDLARLAEHRHVHAKLSGLLMPIVGFGFHTRERPPSVGELVDAIGPHIEHALRVFGPKRCLFASNFPMDKVSVPWRTVYAALVQLTASLDPVDQRAVFHDNAARFYSPRKPMLAL